MNDKYGFNSGTLPKSLGLSQDELIAGGVQMARELRALKAVRVEETKARVRELQQLRAMLDNQITNANAALVAAENDAKE